MQLRTLSTLVPALLAAGPALAAQTPSLQQPLAPRQSSLDNPRLGTDRLMTSATSLTFATHAPGDTNRLFVVEKRGRIVILDLNTLVVDPVPYLDIDVRVNGGGSETGLLGLAFHPNYGSNGLFYVHYSDALNDTVIAEYSVTGDPDVADFNSERIVLQVDQPQTNHNGGWIGFGPNDGYLYIALGDGGNFCDTGGGHTSGIGNAQDITANLLGKMLRIDPTGGVPYAIPPSNPFVGVLGDDEIWAYGLRNPWRASFDSATGDLYIGDVGQDLREEVDYQPADSIGGENYGWRCREGNVCSTVNPSGCPTTTGCTCPGVMPSLTDPIHVYNHSPPPAPATFVCTVVGGYVYRGAALPHISGHYFFADYCGNAIWGFRVHNGAKVAFKNWTPLLTPSLDGFNITSIQSFGEDANGEVYIVATGAIYKIVPRP